MFKTTFGTKPAAHAKSLFNDIEDLAKKTGLIRRTSKKFSAFGFVLALLKAVVTGKASFNQLAMELSHSEASSLSAQAIWKRVNESAIRFMTSFTAKALKQRWGEGQVIPCKIFKRVIIEDSSQVKLPSENHEDFPGHGNDKGKTAGCKFDFAFDLLEAEVISTTLHRATDQDRELGKDLVDQAKEGDLFLRDMGYFSLGEFALLEARGAHWLSRLPANVMASDLDGRKLETILRSAKGNKVEFEALLGEAAHPARLLAVRAAPAVAEQRRRERRAEARKHGKEPSQAMLTRDGWYILVTSVEEELMGDDQLFDLYRVRWQIEIIFRAWKQSAHLQEALKRHSNLFHLQALMYAGILHLILTMKMVSLLQGMSPERVLSIEKIADALTSFLNKLTSLEGFANYNPDPRHLQMDRRSRKSLQEIAICALS